jgi:deoxyribodipyrimidine photo-lyase
MTRNIVVWWIKRDARLADNYALSRAAQMRALVLPLFCFEPSVLAAADCSAMHVHAQWQAIRHLRERLRQLELELVIAHGEVVDKLEKLHGYILFSHLFSHEEVGNYITFKCDCLVAAWCRGRGVVYREFPQSSVRRAGVNRDRFQVVWQSRIAQVPPLAIPPMAQSPEMRQLAAKTQPPRLIFPANATRWQPVTEAFRSRKKGRSRVIPKPNPAQGTLFD